MNPTHEVLDALQARLEPTARAAALVRLLRVPAAWQALQQPEFLAAFRAAELPRQLTPAHLASLALGGPLAIPLGPHLAGERSEHSGQAWKDFVAAPHPVNELGTLAFLALEITLQEDPRSTLRSAIQDPASWGDVLALAWTGHPARDRFLPALLSGGEEAGVRLAVQIALSNLDPDEAVRPVVAAYPHPPHRLVRYLREHGEPEFAARVLQATAESHGRGAPKALAGLMEFERKAAEGDPEAAFESLQAAWQEAAAAAAEIADRMAALAAEQGDPVLALEARSQAMQTQPTAARRAAHALSLLRLGRGHDALTGLSADSQAPEEQIALGQVLAATGQPAEAERTLLHATQDASASGAVADHWLGELSQSLQAMDSVDAAIQIARLRADRAPAHSEARQALLDLLQDAGDHAAAAQQAHLALELEPARTSARIALAENWMRAGQPAAALPLWEELAGLDSAYLPQLAHCALAAGSVERAEQVAAGMLQQQPASVEASILLARGMAARGDSDGAQERLRQVVANHPDSVEARLTLAECQLAGDQQATAGETLFAAVQAMPHEPQTAVALSRWLREQGRMSEAAEVAKGALGAEPDHSDALIELGEASLQIGAQEQALQSFGRAARRQPGNWRARLGLARAHEQAGHVLAGYERIGQLPDNVPAAALIDAARITILAAEVQGQAQVVAQAKSYLQQAAQQTPDDPAIELWSARAHEATGRPHDALAGYRRCLAHFAQEDAESYATALLGIGRTAITAGELPLALSTLEQAQKRFPTSSEVQCLLAEAYGSVNLPEKAVKAAERAIEIDGGHAPAWSTLGRARAAMGDFEGALQAYRGLSSVRPADTQGWMELAGMAQQAEAPEVMRKALAEALWRGRRSASVLCQAADVLEGVDSTAGALRLLRAAVAAQPEDQTILARLAATSQQAGDLKTAHRAWAGLARLDPQNAVAFQRSAEALWGMERRREAIADWRRALELDPHDTGLHRSLGRAYLQVGEVQHGLNQYSAAIQSNPDDASLPLEAGILTMRCGAHAEAGDLLAAAVEGDPASPQAWAALGECRALLGRWGDADLALSRAGDLGAVQTRIAALRVLAALGMGDLASAAAWLDQAGRIAPQTRDDVIWMARATLRMGEWAGAVQTLEAWPQGSPDPAVEHALRELRFSILEADWIYRNAGAEASAPDTAMIQDAAQLDSSEPADRLRAALLDGSEQAVQDALQAGSAVPVGQSMAIGWLRLGQPEAALSALENVRPRSYEFDWRPVLQAIALQSVGRRGEALEALEISAQDPVLRPISEAMQAQIRQELGDGAAAIEAWNRALAARPKEAGWQYALACEYMARGEIDAGLPHLQQAVELAPGDMGYRMQLAKALYACGHSSEAVASFKLAIQRSEPGLEELLQAGQAALESQAAEQAAAWYEQAQGLAPNEARALVGAARAAMALGKNRKARERIETALRAAPHDPEVLLGQGEILAMQRDFQGALQAFGRVRGASGALKSRLIQAKSAALLALGQIEQAERGLIEALEQTGDDPGLWYPLARLHESKGDLASAAEAASQAARLAPLNPDYRLALARISRSSGNLDRALDELVRARELAPGDPRVPLEQGLVYEDRRDFRRALEAYRHAIELDPRCTQAYYRSGLVLKQLKSYPQAGQMLKQAAELAPVDRDVMHQLAAVRALELVHGPSAGVVQ